MASKTTNRFSPEVRTRAVRLVFEHEKDHSSRWATVTSIAAKIGCTAQSLNEWVKKAETDSGVRRGVPSEIAERLKALERENRELRQANEILRKASAYFAQAELDRRFKNKRTRPERSERRFRMFIATPVKVLRRPLESTQYVSIKYTERLAEAGIEPSVGSVGDSYDCESVGAARRA